MRIDRKLLVLVAATMLTLAACSPGEDLAEKIIESQDGVDDVEIDSDSGEVNIESDEGSFTVGGGQVPGGFPVDVPSGGDVIAQSQSDQLTTLVMEFVGGDYDEIEAFYEDWASKSGMDQVQDIQVSDPKGRAWTLQDGSDVHTISISDEGDGVALTIVIAKG